MQSLSDDERKQALGEVLAEELKAIHELVKDVPEMKQKIDVLDSDMKEVKSYIKVIKAAVTDISREQKEHDRRKTHLEAA